MGPDADKSASARDAFERASALVRAGDADAAETVCRDALERLPADGNLLCLLGTVLVRQRRPGEAETILRGVTERFPEFVKAHEELGNALLAQGRLEEAAIGFRRALELNPDNALANYKLARVLAALGRDAEASAAHESSSRLDPLEDALVRAAEKRGAGRTAEAEQIYRDILARDPDNAEAYELYGDLAMEQRQFADAVVMYRRAVGISPDRASAWLSLGKVLGARDEFEAAIEATGRAAELEPRASLPHLQIALFQGRLGRHDQAIAAHEAALAIQPDNAGCLLGLGHALRTVGRHDDAVRTYRRLIRAHPDSGAAYWSLANLKSVRFEAEEIAAMQEQLASKSLPGQQRVDFLFALAKAKEDDADYARAFEYYARGNAARRKVEVYDGVETQVISDRIIAAFDRPLFEARKRAGDPDPAPIFIVGLPRSGSTLIEQILASHSMVRGTRELPFLERIVDGINRRQPQGTAYPEAIRHLDGEQLAGLGSQYLESARRYQAGASHFTDKTPGNFRSIGLLQLILPNARVINARRHPLDSCLGSYKQLFASGQPYTYDLFELGQYYLDYQRLMEHWHRVLPGQVLDVHYEDMVREPEQQIRRLLDYCGLPWQDACINFHETERAIESASSEQVRQPIYTTSVNSWRHFEVQIGELIEILEPVLLALPEEQRPASLRDRR